MAWRIVTVTVVAVFLAGCDQVRNFLQPPQEPPEFELRDFVVTEMKHDATTYSKQWNEFKGVGNIVARNMSPTDVVVVLLDVRDKSLGPDAEPQMGFSMLRGGLGKIEMTKSKYGEMSERPDYGWAVVGWSRLQPGSITVPAKK